MWGEMCAYLNLIQWDSGLLVKFAHVILNVWLKKGLDHNCNVMSYALLLQTASIIYHTSLYNFWYVWFSKPHIDQILASPITFIYLQIFGSVSFQVHWKQRPNHILSIYSIQWKRMNIFCAQNTLFFFCLR